MTGFRFAAFVEAEVRLLPPSEGGRRSAIASGYRCNCWVGHTDGGQRVYNDATIHLLDADRLEPGATARARVEPHFPDDWSHLTVGSRFELCEGARVVGIATVTGLFPAVMRRTQG
jgi:translation elongation factor EF-Tu-like GTPase